jgi:hypothetical protein
LHRAAGGTGAGNEQGLADGHGDAGRRDAPDAITDVEGYGSLTSRWGLFGGAGGREDGTGENGGG